MPRKNVYGIDLGTCNIKVCLRGSEEVVMEKDVVALTGKTRLYASGDDAYAMYEKAPENIEISFPVVNGVIAHYNNMQLMIEEILTKHIKHTMKGSTFVVAVPTDITEVEKKAFFDVFYKSKLKPKNVLLCEKPIADGVGLDLDVTSPTGYMIVNLGADTTEISVTSLGGLVISELLHFGGTRIDESIRSYLKRNYNLLIGMRTASHLKEILGNGIPDHEVKKEIIVGRDVVSGLPIEMEVTSKMVYEAIKDNLNTLCNAIKMILERTPPELARDVMKSGIYLTGGSSKIANLDKLFTQISGIRVNLCEAPEESAVRGLGRIMTDGKLKKLAYNMNRRVYT